MLNLSSPSEAQAVYVPVNGMAIVPPVALTARSTHDAGEPLAFSIFGREVIGDFVRLLLVLPEGLHTGEWEYTLTAGGKEVSRGIMQVGAMPADAASVQYNKEIVFKEYGND